MSSRWIWQLHGVGSSSNSTFGYGDGSLCGKGNGDGVSLCAEGIHGHKDSNFNTKPNRAGRPHLVALRSFDAHLISLWLQSLEG